MATNHHFLSVGGQGAFVKDYNFDPLGLAEKAPEMVPWYRECEIKHGRIAMLAVVGFITAEYVRIPGDMYQVRSRKCSAETATPHCRVHLLSAPATSRGMVLSNSFWFVLKTWPQSLPCA